MVASASERQSSRVNIETTLKKLGSSPLTQPPLPFAQNALAPVISPTTIAIHYGKHHATYFDRLRTAISSTPLTNRSLEEVILRTSDNGTHVGVFNNAAQAWNHNFYWKSLSPQSQKPSGQLLSEIKRSFQSLVRLQEMLSAACAGQFGSGWGWLVLAGNKLKVVTTGNADLPFVHNQIPLLTIDVWEHAYYLDYQNRRTDYLNGVIYDALNWEFAAENLERAQLKIV